VNVPRFLGLDFSTQAATAMLLDVAPGRCDIAFETGFDFDAELPEYGTRHGVLPSDDPRTAQSSPVMWAEALERILSRVARSGLALGDIRAVSGSAQQHGSVYLNPAAAGVLSTLDSARPLRDQIRGVFSRAVSPVWMDSSTATECAEIEAAVGGASALARRTGSRAFERFTGPQIRRFYKHAPTAYASTARIHLVSSFVASLLAGRDAPLDPGDASGMNLMDLAANDWWPEAVDATAPGLGLRLPRIVPSSAPVGELAAFWRSRYGYPAASVIAWSGDNPCSLVGTGLVYEGGVGVSLGTSDTIFGLMRAPRVDPSGTGHVFGAPTGDYMGLTCVKNGSLARERVRDQYSMSWDRFSESLDRTPPGNLGRLMLPWFDPEITPTVLSPSVHRFDLPIEDAAGNVRAVVEAQQLSLARHSNWMQPVVDTIYATGGASANLQILQVMADVFGADVYRLREGNSACLGAALRAWHASEAAEGRGVSWDEVVRTGVRPLVDTIVRARPDVHAIYREMAVVHRDCEAFALGRGSDPSAALDHFRRTVVGQG
jgi:xylulokinase